MSIIFSPLGACFDIWLFVAFLYFLDLTWEGTYKKSDMDAVAESLLWPYSLYLKCRKYAKKLKDRANG